MNQIFTLIYGLAGIVVGPAIILTSESTLETGFGVAVLFVGISLLAYKMLSRQAA